MGPAWNSDDAIDSPRLAGNALRVVRTVEALAPLRTLPDVDLVTGWHRDLYDGCTVPSDDYRGAFRGDSARSDLLGYEVGLGPVLTDGFREKMGVPSSEVAFQVATFVRQLRDAVSILDSHLPVGVRPDKVEELDALVTLAAEVHGEWVRIHPFANGNGRTARTWVAWLMLHYSMPMFLSLTPRPGDIAYAQAGHASMGRPPDYVGDHELARHVFAYLLAVTLLP